MGGTLEGLSLHTVNPFTVVFSINTHSHTTFFCLLLNRTLSRNVSVMFIRPKLPDVATNHNRDCLWFLAPCMDRYSRKQAVTGTPLLLSPIATGGVWPCAVSFWGYYLNFSVLFVVHLGPFLNLSITVPLLLPIK